MWTMRIFKGMSDNDDFFRVGVRDHSPRHHQILQGQLPPSEQAINLLMLGPTLIKEPNKLKKIILENENAGFSISSHQQSVECEG